MNTEDLEYQIAGLARTVEQAVEQVVEQAEALKTSIGAITPATGWKVLVGKVCYDKNGEPLEPLDAVVKEVPVIGWAAVKDSIQLFIWDEEQDCGIMVNDLNNRWGWSYFVLSPDDKIDDYRDGVFSMAIDSAEKHKQARKQARHRKENENEA